MNRIPSIAAVGLVAVSSLAGSDAAQQIHRASDRQSTPLVGNNFTGKATFESVFAASGELPVAGAYARFEPGARSAWHSHPAGQRLIVIEGAGLTQEWGKPIQEIRAGDVVICPAGVKHWHGAAPTTSMTHLAITGVVNGEAVSWMEAVSDSQYRGE
jgi:quercetin dioxygenase-like cupin family protein